jgi:hypothetical protein
MAGRERLFNVLTLATLALTVLLIAWYVAIAINPYSPVNPFPPSGPIQLAIIPPLDGGPPSSDAPPTWTPTATATASPTPPPTFTPTATPAPEPTFTPRPTATPTPRATVSAYPFTYELAYETPYHGCDWAGVAGLVQDLDGKPLTGYAVHIWGGGLDLSVPSGSAPSYGEAGWEQFLNDHPMQVQEGIFKVQLHDKDPPHAAVSEVVNMEFAGYCSQSMAFVVFTKNH